MLNYKNEWVEEVFVYAEKLNYGMRIVFAKKSRSDTFLIPKDKVKELITLITGEE